jgi:hypothetical protein
MYRTRVSSIITYAMSGQIMERKDLQTLRKSGIFSPRMQNNRVPVRMTNASSAAATP